MKPESIIQILKLIIKKALEASYDATGAYETKELVDTVRNNLTKEEAHELDLIVGEFLEEASLSPCCWEEIKHQQVTRETLIGPAEYVEFCSSCGKCVG